MKAKREHKWRVLLFASPLVLVTMPFWLQAGQAALENWDYVISDGISRADIDTRRILRRYEATNDTKEISNWLLNGPTEAPGAQMCMTLADWATQHQNQFTAIVESLPMRERKQFIEVFCASLNQ